jgi:hypothetical protein
LGDAETRAADIDGGALMASEPKLEPSDLQRLQREAERLIAAGEMPSLAEVLSVVSEVRAKYRPLILAARRASGQRD